MSKNNETMPLVKGDEKKEEAFYFVPTEPRNLSLNSEVFDQPSFLGSTPTSPKAKNSPWWWPFGKKSSVSQSSGPVLAPQVERPRKVPVKIEPKVYFANERTFLAWMHMTVTLASIAVAILAFANQNEWSQIYGLLILPVAICFCLYALYNFLRRATLLRRRAPGPYEDTFGPTFLATILMVSILLNFAVKLYDIYG